MLTGHQPAPTYAPLRKQGSGKWEVEKDEDKKKGEKDIDEKRRGSMFFLQFQFNFFKFNY